MVTRRSSMGGQSEDLLLVRHDLHLHALTVEVVEAQVLTGGANIVYTTGKLLSDTLKLLSGLDLALRAILFDVMGDRCGNVELVRVGVGGLGLLELHDLPRPNLKVLLRRGVK